MRRTVAVTLALCFQILSTRPSAAADRPWTKGRWYGWEILLVDVASMSLMVAGATTYSEGKSPRIENNVVLVGCASYLVAAPLIHAAHGRLDSASGTSFGARLLLPAAGLIAGTFFGIFAAIGAEDVKVLQIVAYSGMGAGALVASGLDIGALAYERVRRAPAAPPLALGVAPVRGGLTAGLSGVF